MTSDLSALDTVAGSNAGSDLELSLSNGTPIVRPDGRPVTIKLLGKDSDAFIKADAHERNLRLQQGQRLKLTAEGMDASGIKCLAKASISWDGVGWMVKEARLWEFDGDELPCTYENAVRLYTRLPDIKEQVDNFVGDRSNFLKG